MVETHVLDTAPGFGRALVTFDERSRNYPARGALFAADAPLQTKTWRRPPAYDQGETSQCVAYSGMGVVNTKFSSPGLAPSKRKQYAVDTVYNLAQSLDPWEGNAYNGTSVLAGFQAMTQLGFVSGYRWCFGVDDVLRTLSSHGPVILGIDWFASMMTPDGRGRITPDLRTQPYGHAVEVHGIDVKREEVIGTNSWGLTWGANGRFRLGFKDLDMLLQRNGESVTIG